MITGFHFYSREKDEDEFVWWERESKLRHYHWMFRKAECKLPNECKYCDPSGAGCCLIFTYSKR